MKSRKAQEEMIGFVLIIIIVMIIILVFVGLSLKKSSNKAVESYEVDSFIQSSKQYTTDCVIGTLSNYRNINQLALDCKNKKRCNDNRDTCEVLNLELKNMLNKSWNIQEGSPIKGYSLIIKRDDEAIINITEGNSTRNYNGPTKGLDDELNIDLRVYV